VHRPADWLAVVALIYTLIRMVTPKISRTEHVVAARIWVPLGLAMNGLLFGRARRDVDRWSAGMSSARMPRKNREPLIPCGRAWCQLIARTYRHTELWASCCREENFSE